MLEVTNLDCVRGGRTLFKRLTQVLRPELCYRFKVQMEVARLALLRIICGLLARRAVKYAGKGGTFVRSAEEYALQLAYVGHRNGIKEELTSLENLRIAGGIAGIKITHDKPDDALKQVGLEGRENLPVRFLSEGQRRRSASGAVGYRRNKTVGAR